MGRGGMGLLALVVCPEHRGRQAGVCGGLLGGARLKLSRELSYERWPELLLSPWGSGFTPCCCLARAHACVPSSVCVCVHSHVAPPFSEPAHFVPLFELPSPNR